MPLRLTDAMDALKLYLGQEPEIKEPHTDLHKAILSSVLFVLKEKIQKPKSNETVKQCGYSIYFLTVNY